MKKLAPFVLLALVCGRSSAPGADAPPADKKPGTIPWPAGLPVYDHVVIVVEENKDYDQIIDKAAAPYINKTLRREGANFTRMFGEEHYSKGNYFWLFSGSNQNVGFKDRMPAKPIVAPNLGAALIARGLSFKGYSEDLPAIGSTAVVFPEKGKASYARKHVPWVSFANVPNGTTAATSSNLRFEDFPTDPAKFSSLPTVAIVVPNLMNDMHNGAARDSIPRGDAWLQRNLDPYYQWARKNNSLLIVTFDECDDQKRQSGLTDPFIVPKNRAQLDRQNRICTLFAGAHIKPGDYAEDKGINHVTILRTLEAMYGLPRSGTQQEYAVRGGISDDFIITDAFRTGDPAEKPR